MKKGLSNMSIIILKYRLRLMLLIVLAIYNFILSAQNIKIPSSRDMVDQQQSRQSMPTNTPQGTIQMPSGTNNFQNNKTYDIEQQQRETNQRMGLSVPTQEDIRNAQKRWLEGQPPELTEQEKINREMRGLLNEVNQINTLTSKNDYYHSAYFTNDFPNYKNAKNLIREMLEGKRDLSVKDAFFLAESAYGNLHLSYKEYEKTINDNANFIRNWMKQHKYDLSNIEMLHYGIQKFMSDTLYININGKRQGHIPYYYDYIDPTAKDDKRNYFVTKTIATGSGQCHTFPVTYLILAEALGVEAGLAYNPRHSFIRYANNEGTTVNYETTIDKFLPNAFYTETLPVMAATQKNNIYVNNFSRKQVVASVLFELAYSFIEEHWLSDRTFINECMAIATPYFSDNEYINLTHSNLKKILYADAFNSKVQEKHIKDLSQIQQYPEVLEAYQDYYGYMEKISKLGIQDFPESEYLRMLEYYDYKSKLQTAKKINAKTRKSLFIN